MSTEVIDTLQVTDTLRACFYYDDSPESPRQWASGVSVHPIRSGRNTLDPAPGDDTHGHALEAIIDNADDVEAAVLLHFSRAGLPAQISRRNDAIHVWYVERELLNENLGLSPEWALMEYLAGEMSTYEQWAEGQVFVVAFQRAVEYQRVDGAPGSVTLWSDEGFSISGMYGDLYTPAQQAEMALEGDTSELDEAEVEALRKIAGA